MSTYDTQIPEYKYQYPSSSVAQGKGESAAAEDTKTAENEGVLNEVLDTAFSSDTKTQKAGANAASASSDTLFPEEKGTAAGDTFTANTGAAAGETIEIVNPDADVETLQAQQETVNAQVKEASNSQADIGNELERYTNIIAAQDEHIADLNEQINELENSTQNLERANLTLFTRIERCDAEIARLDTLIQANSGFLGTISNGVSNIFGKGVDVKALKDKKARIEAEKADLEAQKANNDEAIANNNKQIDGKNLGIEITEQFKAKNEEHAAALKEELDKLEDKIKNGTATLEEIEAAIKTANEKEGVKASDEDVRKLALTYMTSGAEQKGEFNADEAGIQGSNYLNSADENGQLDNTLLTDILESQGGLSEEEAIAKMEIIEAIATYEEIGLSLDAADIATMTVAELSSVTESAIIQEVLKSTSTKVMGNAKSITSKKEMDAQADARDNFIASNNALNGYYSANDVDDFEVQAFLSLSDNMVSNINQGYIYDTSALQQMTNNADTLLSTLMTKVSTTEGVSCSTEAQFMQEKTKTESILGDTEKSLGDNTGNNDKFTDCTVEFLNLTSGFNNAESDSEQISYIRLMKELGEKGERIKDNPDSQNPYLDGSLWIAA